VPHGLDVHLVMDNYATHKTPLIVRVLRIREFSHWPVYVPLCWKTEGPLCPMALQDRKHSLRADAVLGRRSRTRLRCEPRNRTAANWLNDGRSQPKLVDRRKALSKYSYAAHFPLNPTVRTRKQEVAMPRHRSKPHSFEDQLAAEKGRLTAQLALTPHGPARDALVEKIRQIETASRLNEWLSSPGLRPPS